MPFTKAEIAEIPLWKDSNGRSSSWFYEQLARYASEVSNNRADSLTPQVAGGASSFDIGTLTLDSEPILYFLYERTDPAALPNGRSAAARRP